MGADDLELNSGSRRDKITHVNDRFYCAIYGADISADILGFLDFFKGTQSYKEIVSIEEFASKFKKVAEKFLIPSRKQWVSLLKNKQISPEHYTIATTQTCSLVVWDNKNSLFYDLDFGPCQNIILTNPDLTPLKEDTVHGFALAKNLTIDESLNSSITDKSLKEYLSSVLKNHRQTQPAIGELGAYFFQQNGKISLHSAFNSIEDVIDELSKGMLGKDE